MLTVMIFTSDKCFEMVKISHKMLEGNTTKCKMREATDTMLPPPILATSLVQYNYLYHLWTLYHTFLLPKVKFNGVVRK